MKPRVGIDAHFLSRPEGNRTYVVNLLRGLARVASDRFEVVVFAADPDRDRVVVGEAASAFRWERIAGSGAVRFLRGIPAGLDLWHATFVAPRGRARVVLAVHDALALVRPELLPAGVRAKLRVLLPRSIERARVVLVPTEAVKRDLAAFPNVRVAPIGIDTDVFAPGGAVEDYALAVGRADPRKRVDLIRAAVGSRRLVVAGPGQEVTPSEPELAGLYRGARVFVFASAGEGLGLPVLEALACGTPVVATDIPAVREVAGGAVFALVPPGDEGALRDAVARAFEIGAEERADLARRGREVALRFSLEAMARAVLQAWEDALTSSS